MHAGGYAYIAVFYLYMSSDLLGLMQCVQLTAVLRGVYAVSCLPAPFTTFFLAEIHRNHVRTPFFASCIAQCNASQALACKHSWRGKSMEDWVKHLRAVSVDLKSPCCCQAVSSFSRAMHSGPCQPLRPM